MRICCCGESLENKPQNQRFCTLTCFNDWQKLASKSGTWWQSVYPDWETQKREHAKKSARPGKLNGMFGRRDQMHGLQKFVSGTVGKTVEQIHGKEKGQALRALFSSQRQGEANPAFGKAYLSGGRSIKGYYKGFFFRSLLEYSFMKHLETQGFSLIDEIRYECFRVPYEFKGKSGTYLVDFHVIPENIVYEVKPAYVLKKPPAQQLAKWAAARVFLRELGLEFKLVSEEDFQKRLFKDVYGVDVDVVWDERTFKYFKETVKCRVKS